jgi:tetratricopeptide (TPR) repeat protein
MRDALKSLDGVTADQQIAADATKALIVTQLAQDTMDRALLGDKAQSDKLKKDAKQMVLDASTPAQKAFKGAADDPGANLAMAAVLRLQGKTQKDIQPYIDRARAKMTPDWKREEALGEALALISAGKLDDAKALLTPVDTGDDKLENTGDVRVRFRLAMIAFAQNKGADAKPLVDSVLATAPDHVGAKALAAKLSSSVVSSDPMPTEEPRNPVQTPKNPTNTNTVTPPQNTGGGGDTYDALLAKANKLAESNCSKAIDVYGKALEQKPNGVEALTGMGYCHIDAKQFASAFSKFRAALAVSSKYEPALWGIAEAYMQQGRKEQAVDAVKAYMDVYPGAAKAQKALDRLGGSTPAPTAPETPSQPTQTPAPTPAPVPAPAPEGPTTTPSE